MTETALLWVALVAFGQLTPWERHMGEASRLADAGRYSEAKAAYQSALQCDEKQVKTWNDLALMNRYLGNFAESRRQYGQALALTQSEANAESAEYATVLNNLATLDYQELLLNEAARKFRNALGIRERLLDGNDPAIAQTLSSLSAVYVAQRRFTEAERLARRALAIKDRKLGPEDPLLAPTLDNLAFLYVHQRRPEMALEMVARADRLVRKAYGDRHPLTAQHMTRQATLLAYLSRYAEAAGLLHTALEIQLSMLGENNIDVASTRANLAEVCFRLRSEQEAESQFRLAVAVLQRVCRPDDPRLAKVLLNYAALLRQTGRKPDGKRMESRAHAILAMRPSDKLTMDVSDLLSKRR